MVDQLMASDDDESRYIALVERFRQFGCGNAEGWARSEIDENIPQLARFVFLRQLWNLVITPEAPRRLNDYAGPNDDGRGGALRRIKECGVASNDLLTIVREAQIDVIREVASILDELNTLDSQYDGIRWGLFEIDDNDCPTRPIDCLHESVDDEDVIPRPQDRRTNG
ncbi:hypothetical protein [Posidoniimonas polymericola]|uniref:hypothetical protein n=1 Tax=Posidoniimonas polymericola TaxID=2528002 RepID=UPI0011B5C520|nr:hypothetical protein [Posidoniimonas polymericola]